MIIPGIIFWLAVFAAVADPLVGLGLLSLALLTAVIQLVFQRSSRQRGFVSPYAHK